MKLHSHSIARVGITLLATAGAIYAGWQLWRHYEIEPWTRDGRVKAYVVQVAPDVTGQVTKVFVHDNQQVKAGDVLFEVDRARFELALRQADAAEQAAQAALNQASAKRAATSSSTTWWRRKRASRASRASNRRARRWRKPSSTATRRA